MDSMRVANIWPDEWLEENKWWVLYWLLCIDAFLLGADNCLSISNRVSANSQVNQDMVSANRRHVLQTTYLKYKQFLWIKHVHVELVKIQEAGRSNAEK